MFSTFTKSQQYNVLHQLICTYNQQLLARRIDHNEINLTDEKGMNALGCAILGEDVAMVNTLLRHGSAVNLSASTFQPINLAA